MSIPQLADPVTALQQRLETTDRRWIVGLAGVPGSGKTTLAARIAAEIDARCGAGRMLVLGMDGFHLPKSALAAMPDPALAFARRGAPWTFDRAGLAARLRELRTGFDRSAVAWPDFQHDVGDPVEGAHSVPPDVRLILVEGIYVLQREEGWDEVSSNVDERWYLDTPFDLAMQRLAQRHISAWGMTREEAEARVNGNDRLNAEWIVRSRQYADYLV